MAQAADSYLREDKVRFALFDQCHACCWSDARILQSATLKQKCAHFCFKVLRCEMWDMCIAALGDRSIMSRACEKWFSFTIIAVAGRAKLYFDTLKWYPTSHPRVWVCCFLNWSCYTATAICILTCEGREDAVGQTQPRQEVGVGTVQVQQQDLTGAVHTTRLTLTKLTQETVTGWGTWEIGWFFNNKTAFHILYIYMGFSCKDKTVVEQSFL